MSVAESPRLGPDRAWRRVRLGGRDLWLDSGLAVLDPYPDGEAGGAGACSPPPAPPPAPDPTPPDLVSTEIEGLLAGRVRRLSVRHTAAGSWIEVPGIVSLWVAADGSAVGVTATSLGRDDPWLVEGILGPGLILALARQGTYCLHASAVGAEGRGLAFVGDSGAGKSTLARLLVRPDGGAWAHLADDILPLAPDRAGPRLRPDFPQLKVRGGAPLSAAAMAAGGWPVAAVYQLAVPEQGAPEEVQVRRLAPAEAALTLLSHTVARRLFPEALARRHFGDLVAMAGLVPVRRLAYPHRPDVGPAVAAAIRADLAAAPEPAGAPG